MFHQSLPHAGAIFFFFPAFSCRQRTRIRIILVFDEQTDIPNLVLSPIQVPIELPRIVFPTTILPMGVHIIFVQEVPQDLQCLHRISAICVVEDVSIRPDILTQEF